MNITKIILSAYACEPYKGSEPAVGWNFVLELSKKNKLFVITRKNNKQSIEAELKKNPLPNVQWFFFDLPWFLRFWKRGNRGIQLYYYLWQIGIYFFAKNILKKNDINIIHHITFVKYWVPSFLSFHKIPFVFGPVGGGESAPKVFSKIFSKYGKVVHILRTYSRRFAEFDPFLKLAIKRTKLSIATTSETFSRLKELDSYNLHILSQVGFTTEELHNMLSRKYTKNTKFTIISIGRLIYWKGYILSIKAFCRFARQFKNSEYHIIGQGQEKPFLLKQIDYSCRDKIIFHDKFLHEKTLERLGKSHLLAHPSLHDSGGFVVAEAISLGVPVACLNLGGPAMMVNERNGFIIEPISPEDTIRKLQQVFQWSYENPGLLADKGRNGRAMAKDMFSFEKKAAWVNEQYQKILNENSTDS